MTIRPEAAAAAAPRLAAFPKALFMRVGVLPVFLLVALVTFSIASLQFLTVQNLVNVARQSVYLVLVSLGQMVVLITGGFDLAVGTTIALTSVLAALFMNALAPALPGAEWAVICLAILGAMGVALAIGLVNGAGVAFFGVSPFIMTLGVQSMTAGAALFLTGGVPVSGLPHGFGDTFGFGRILGVPMPVLVALLAIGVIAVFLYGTRLGRHVYAIGGNIKAARLSGVNTYRALLIAYAVSALLASLAGLLLTARTESGEPNLGGSLALESIAACVIGGVSLRGGIGRVENVVLGAFFIILVENGMNMMQVGSYMQMVLLGLLLILAVVADQFRYKLIVGSSG